MTNSKQHRALTRCYGAIIAQLDDDDAKPISEYVEALNRTCAGQRAHIRRLQESAQPPVATTRFTAAVVEILGAAQNGTTYPDLAIIAIAHELSQEEHQWLGIALWDAIRRDHTRHHELSNAPQISAEAQPCNQITTP